MNFQNMMNNMMGQWGNLGLWFWPLLIWSFVWKGLALWRAVKEDSRGWFVALLVVNTLGILEIFYLFVFSKKKGIDKIFSK